MPIVSDDLRLDGRRAIVTGAARGLGEATARLLAARGAHVLLCDRDEAVLAHTRDSIPGSASIAGSVTDAAYCEKAVDRAVQAWGGLDILVNCAGIAGVNERTWELSEAQFRDVVDVSLVGTFLMCRAAVPAMIPRDDERGRIVNVASMAGKDGNPRAAHYSAAKAGVIALTKSLGKELAQSGVLANVIAPAVIETDMARAVSSEQLEYMRRLIPMGRLGRPEEVARLVAFLVSDQVSFSTGAVYDISGGRATY